MCNMLTKWDNICTLTCDLQAADLSVGMVIAYYKTNIR